MAEAISPTTGRRHGVVRVCRAWEVARSSFYAARRPEAEAATAAVVSARRGPKPAVSDRALLAAIRADLARSPWTGEGHRKVWARLRAMDVSDGKGPFFLVGTRPDSMPGAPGASG
jgi:putative transposase